MSTPPYPSLAHRASRWYSSGASRRSSGLSAGLLGGVDREPVPQTALGRGTTDSADALRDLWTKEPDTTVRRAAAQGLAGPVGWRERNARDDVARVEVLLGHLGYKDLRHTEGPTGYFGSPQQSAIQGFQKDHDLKTDGIVLPGGPTWSALVQRARTPAPATRSQSGDGTAPGDSEEGDEDEGEQKPWPNPPVPPHKPEPPEEKPSEEQDCRDLWWELYDLWQQRDDVNAALRSAENEREVILRQIADLDRNPSFDPSIVIPNAPEGGRGRGRGRGPLIDGIFGIWQEITKDGQRDALREERDRLQAELEALEAEIERLRTELAALDDAIAAAEDALEACRDGEGGDGGGGDGPGGSPDGEAPAKAAVPRPLGLQGLLAGR